MPFESLPPADRRILSELMARVFNPLANPVMGVMGQSAGPYGQRNSTIQLPKDVFLAKITDVSGTGYAALYSFVEMQIKPDGTGLEETFNGRVAICCVGSGDTLAIRPARYILDDTLTENTLVLARVSIAESNEFEILGVLDGTGGGISTGGCTGKLGWTLDTASLTLFDLESEIFPRAMSVAVLESFGRCECVSAPAGDAPTIRFFQALEDGLPDPFSELVPRPGDVRLIAKWNGVNAWEGMGSLATCCSGCSSFTFAIDTVATLLLERPVFTMTVYGGCTGGSGTPAPKTFTVWTECGNDRYVVLAGFDTQACEFDPRPECVNLFRIGVVCVECDVPDVGCQACMERVAPPYYKATAGGRVYYLRTTGDCGCAWESDCGTASLSVAGTKITLVTDDGTYEYDTNDFTPGCDLSPPCWAQLTLTKDGGGEATISPRFCKDRPDTGGDLCVEGTPDLYVSISVEGCATQTATMGYDSETGYSASGFVWGDCVGCLPETEEYTFTAACSPDGCGAFSWSILLGAPTGEGSGMVLTVVTDRPFYATFTGTLVCSETGVGPPFVETPFTGFISQIGSGTPWWCVSGDCVQSATEPEGGVGPFTSDTSCIAGCECEGGSGSGMGLMASALPTSRASIPLAKSNPRDRRYVPMPMAKCPYLGDLLTPCTSCGGNKPERDVYACDHPDNEDGRCTKGDPGKFGEWTCGTCDRHPSKIASREWPSPIDTRHLLFHIAPVAFNNGEAWRWNVEQVRQRQHLFNGRKVAAVLTPGKGFSLDSGMVVQSERWNLDSADAVREALGDGWEVIEMPNDPKLREVATWVPLWSRLEEFALPGHAAFYCHSKGVTRTAPQIREWTRMLYESNLDFLDRVDALLAAYPIVGPFKKVGRGWPMKDTASAWHFSGTFMHVRLQDFFRRDWERVDPFWSGTEAWPGIAYDVTEAGCLFHEGKVEAMNLYSPKYIAAVATEFDAWKTPSAK